MVVLNRESYIRHKAYVSDKIKVAMLRIYWRGVVTKTYFIYFSMYFINNHYLTKKKSICRIEERIILIVNNVVRCSNHIIYFFV